MQHQIIDSHVHCGRQFAEPPQAFEDYLAAVGDSGITGAVMMPPVMEVYDRRDPGFQDNEHWRSRRRRAHQYLLDLVGGPFEVIPYFFIWNDFAVEQIDPRHGGIKWHRHPDEPAYRYDDPSCAAAIAEIRRRNMSVLLEEELDNTLRFLDELAVGLRVIIPHMGNLNGGYEVLRRLKVWERPSVYTDTSCSPTPEMIGDYVERYGHKRIMFGSDFPFSNPARDLEKVMKVKLSDQARMAILSGNLRRLLADSNRSRTK